MWDGLPAQCPQVGRIDGWPSRPSGLPDRAYRTPPTGRLATTTSLTRAFVIGTGRLDTDRTRAVQRASVSTLRLVPSADSIAARVRSSLSGHSWA